jgi:hypothetical protein
MVRRNKNQGILDPVTREGFPFKAKSRLFILGSSDLDDVRTDAPTTSRTGINVAACRRLKLFPGDVSSAFLNGLEIKRNLYFRLPGELAQYIPKEHLPPDLRSRDKLTSADLSVRSRKGLWTQGCAKTLALEVVGRAEAQRMSTH